MNLDDRVMIDKVSRIYHSKFNMSQFGFDYHDSRSVVSEVYLKALKRYDPKNKAKFETFLSKCVNNAFIDIIRNESKDPLNASYSIEDSTFDFKSSTCEEWSAIRDILSRFEGVERLIVKEILDPSDDVVNVISALAHKNNFLRYLEAKANMQYQKKFAMTDVLIAISRVYSIPEEMVYDKFSEIQKKLSKRLKK